MAFTPINNPWNWSIAPNASSRLDSANPLGDTSDPQPGTLQFTSSTYTVSENGGTVTLTVERVNGSDGAVSCDLDTANGTASAGSDYTAVNTVVEFADGVTTQTVNVSIADNATVDGSRDFTATLTNAQGGASLGSPSTATATITDDDSSTPGTSQGLPMTLTVSDSGSGAGRPLAIGMPLAEGALAAGETLVLEDSGGSQVPCQWSPLTSWRTDGSQLHGMLAAQLDAGGTYTVKAGTSDTGTAISKADIKAAGFDAVVSVDISGTLYSLSAADLLDGTVTPILDYTHFAGHLCAEYAVGAFLRNGGSAHPHLFCMFSLRAFDGGSRIRCEIVVDNRTCQVAGVQDYAASSVTYSVGGTNIENRGATTLYSGRGYRSRGWFGGDPGLWGAAPGPYVQSTKLSPYLRSDLPATSEATLASLPSAFGWNDRGPLGQGGNDGGGSHFQIGYTLSYDGMYLLTSDQRAFNALWAISDVWGICHGGNYGWDPNEPICMREETTGLPFNFKLDTSGGPYGAWGAGNWAERTTAQNTDGGDYAHFNGSHAPAEGAALAYLLTGDYYQLEMLQFLGNWHNYSNPQSGYNYSGNWPRKQNAGGETRRGAWPLSQIASTAALTPDSHPMRTYFEEMVTGQVTLWMGDEGWHRDAVNTPVGTIGCVYASNTLDYNSGRGIGPWMDDYVCWAMSRCLDLGFSEFDTADLWEWKANFSLERFSDGANGWCINNAALYSMDWLKDANGNWNTMADAYTDQFGAFSCDYSDNAGIGAETTIEHYGPYALGALAAVASQGVSGADAAWDRAMAIRNPGYTAQDEANLPKWSIGNRYVDSSQLATQAAALSSGYSVKLNTTLTGAMLEAGDGSDLIQWANTAFWDGIRQRMEFIGKRNGTYPLRRLTYSASDNTWANDGSVPISGTTFGHGYDHTAGDPETGEVYYRNYNGDAIYRLDPDSQIWSQITTVPGAQSVTAATCWWPGQGYYYADGGGDRIWGGSSWNDLGNDPEITYHSVAEYCQPLDAVFVGFGNLGGQRLWRINSDLTMTQVATAGANYGASSGQGLFVPIPGTDQFLGYDKVTNAWERYDASGDIWTTESVSTGDGSTEQTGVPPLSSAIVLACQITDHNVVMFIQHNGAEADADVWLWKP